MRISYKSISLFLLFLFSINFLNMESRLLLVTFVAVLFAGQRWKIPVTTNGVVLGLFSVVFYLFAIVYNSSMITYYVIPYLLGPFIGYSTGMVLLDNSRIDLHKGIKTIILIIVFGRFFHGFLNLVISNGYRGYLRNGIDFWTKSVIAATGQGALMTMSISLLFYSVFILKKSNLKEKITTLCCVIIALLNSLLSASRTAIIIMILIFVLCAIVYSTISSENKLKRIKLISGIVILLLLLFVIFWTDSFGLKTYWENTPLFERVNTESSYEMGDNNRKEMVISTIRNALDYPLGNGDMSATSHNLWLDVLKQTGWVPFLLLVSYTIMVLKNMIRIICFDGVPVDIKFLLLSVIAGSLLNFAVEPILKGMPYYFISFCVIAGALERYCNYMVYSIVEKD